VIIGSDVVISWQMPYNSASLIRTAEIQILQDDGLTFTSELTYCDGSVQSTFDARKCFIPAAVLRSPPFSLAQGSPISPRIRFQNEIGFSGWSAIKSPAYPMQDIPHPPASAPVRIEESTFQYQIGVSFLPLSLFESGGIEVLSYNLQIDIGEGNGDWVDHKGFVSDDLSLTAVITPLTPGQEYWFRYRARNSHGWGEFSPISSVLLANRPDSIPNVLTVNEGLLVKISWDPTPHSRYSDVISYRIKLRRNDGYMLEHS
jgi:hypothetical protein